MKGKAVSGIVLMLLLFILAASRDGIPRAHADPEVAFSIEPSMATIGLGQTVKVNVTITTEIGIASYRFFIYYNSTVLELVSWTFDTDPAHPLSPTQIAPNLVDRVDTDASVPGTVQLATQWKSGVPTYSGSGVAAQLAFTGTMIGNSTLIFVHGWTEVNYHVGGVDPIYTYNDGEIQVRPTTVARAEYNYYVVAGYKMNPTLPPPDTSPAGFTFTLEGWAENETGLHSLGTGGYNFGWLGLHGGRTYLTAGSSISEPTGSNWNAYVVVNITNNLGYTITIEDLTAEVTDGTPMGDLWDPWFGFRIGHPNCSIVVLDTFDPWDYNLIDEVDYYTGAIEQIREDDYPDHYWATLGVIRPSSIGRGPGSLLLNDLNGDAASTGHVPSKYGGNPITLADGETFTEYFGINILGLVDEGTQIDATITARLYYSPPQEGTAALVDVQMSNLQPMFPAFVDKTTYFYPEWANLNFNLTLQNIGNVPVDVTVNLYYSNDETTWIQIGASQDFLNLPVATEQLFNFYWNVKSADLSIGWHFVKANATATNEPLATTCEFDVQVRCVLTGNSDGDNDVDVGDQRKTCLAMFSRYPEPIYLAYNNAATYGPQLFTDFDGDLDVDIGDQRKLQIHLFDSDPTRPTS